MSRYLRDLLHSVYRQNNNATLEDCEMFLDEASYDEIKDLFEEDEIVFDKMTKEFDSLLQRHGHDTLIVNMLQ